MQAINVFAVLALVTILGGFAGYQMGHLSGSISGRQEERAFRDGLTSFSPMQRKTDCTMAIIEARLKDWKQ